MGRVNLLTEDKKKVVNQASPSLLTAQKKKRLSLVS
jgi:hypothetical protein